MDLENQRDAAEVLGLGGVVYSSRIMLMLVSAERCNDPASFWYSALLVRHFAGFDEESENA